MDDRTYMRLDEGIEFDRGSKREQCLRWTKRRYESLRFNIRMILVRGLRACGFVLDYIDAARVLRIENVESRLEQMHYHNLFLALAGCCLIVVTALEPVILKIMADHSQTVGGDYRYILAQLLTLLHIPLCVGSAIWYSCKNSTTALESCDFPKKWFVALAFLNALHMIMLVVACGAVPANLTILLVHANIPFTTLISALIAIASSCYYFMVPEPYPLKRKERVLVGHVPHSNSGYESCVIFIKDIWVKWSHTLLSSGLLVAGVIFGIVPVLSKNENALGTRSFCYQFNNECAASTVLFLLSSVPAAISSLFEEIALVRYSVPVAPIILHGWLVPMQFVFGILLAPVGRYLQHPTDTWHNVTFEMDGLNRDIGAGLRCIIMGEVTGVRVVGMYDPDWCKPLFPLLIAFLAVSFFFHLLTLYLMKHGTEVLLRVCAACAIPLGWGLLALYDLNFRPKLDPIIPTQDAVSWFSIAAMMLVVVGVLFHRTTVEPQTHYVLTSPFEEHERAFIEEASARHREKLIEVRNSTDGTQNGYIAQVLPEPLVDSLDSPGNVY